MLEKNSMKSPETLQFAVYGGITGMLGLLSLVLLFFSAFNCKAGLINAIGLSILSIVLSFMTITFGKRAKTYEGKLVIILGLVILIVVILLYVFGVIPCLLS